MDLGWLRKADSIPRHRRAADTLPSPKTLSAIEGAVAFYTGRTFTTRRRSSFALSRGTLARGCARLDRVGGRRVPVSHHVPRIFGQPGADDRQDAETTRRSERCQRSSL